MANPFVRVGGFFGRFFGNTIGEAAAYGIGGALREPLHPLLQELTNATWEAGTKAGVSKPLDLAMAAEVAAELVDKYDDMKTQASFSGYDAGHFKDAYGVTLTAPGVGTLLALLRRDQTHAIDFGHGLRKNKLETDWDDALAALRHLPLDPSVIAIAIQRGVMLAPFDLPYTPPTKVGKVPAYPPSSLNAALEAAWSGETVERLRVRTALAGLPLALDQAARATFRKIITPDDYARAVLEGNTRGEWADAAFDVAREILTASQYTELQLRGFYDETARRLNTRKHGMTDDDSDLLYKVLGRSVSVHQVTTGLARGGKYPSVYADVPEPFRAAIQRSNVREEWVGLAYANRYSYPSGFQIRSEAQKGDLTYDETHQILLEVGWSPKWAAHFATSWTGGVAAKADPHVSKAQTQLWTTLHRSYLAGESTEAEVSAALPRAGVAAAAVPDVLAVWDEERTIIRKQLSPAQVKKAYAEAVTNPATGSAWTKDEATAALVARGYSTADATTFLEL